MKRVLMIPFHFPPMAGSSGVHRSLNFTRYLPDHDWQPLVLTAHPRVHPNVSNDQLSAIPSDVVVRRVFAVDTARHLSIGGKYPSFLARPDRWMSWRLAAVPAGMRLIRQYRPQAIWSTFPIATAHWIGETLSQKSGLPWIADFRDSMTEEDFPADPEIRRIFRNYEQRTVEQASKVVFTAPGTLQMYRERYPHLPDNKWQIIENGYDENDFRSLEAAPAVSDQRLNLVHSGLLYPEERDPRAFFAALQKLQLIGEITPENCRIILRATGHDSVFQPMIDERGLQGIVELAPAVPYRDALTEVSQASGLLVFQASNCNHQIPAKVYEYLRAQRPILALTDPAGDTAGTLRRFGVGSIAHIDDSEDIARQMSTFVRSIRDGNAQVAALEQVRQQSREMQTAVLAGLLDEVASGR